MRQTEVRAKFPDHKLVFSVAKARAFENRTLSIYVKGTNEFVATIEQRSEKAVAMIVRPGRGKTALAKFVAFAEVGSYKNVHEVEKAMNAERKFDGLGNVEWEDARKQFVKMQDQDFDTLIKMLAVYFGVLENRNNGYSSEHFQYLTAQGKTLYRNAVQIASGATYDTGTKVPAFPGNGGPLRELAMSPDDLAKASKLLQTSPVAQVAQTIAEGKQKREDLDKRTVWGAEDDAIFEMVQADHKILSDRLAVLYSARGSKISIPEFDRIRKAKKEAQ
jgi:hypothetical protein